MKKLRFDRRFLIAIYAISLLAGLGFYLKSAEVAAAISAVAIGLAGANAFEGFKKKDTPPEE